MERLQREFPKAHKKNAFSNASCEISSVQLKRLVIRYLLVSNRGSSVGGSLKLTDVEKRSAKVHIASVPWRELLARSLFQNVWMIIRFDASKSC